MTDIELVIKIPEEIYESSKRECEENDDLIIDTFTLAIGYGTPLPKDHGNLIDYYDAVELINNKADEENSNFTINDIEKFGALLREVNPIIEADEEESEE